MMFKASLLLLSLGLLLLTPQEAAAEKTPVVISHQGPNYWALPIHIATQRGYWEELELEPTFEIVSVVVKQWGFMMIEMRHDHVSLIP
jgi:NitT/TauT family transport system substrate-binding protein